MTSISLQGGMYVSRKKVSKGALAGIIITVLILVGAAAGLTFYFKKFPEKWDHFKTSTRSKFAGTI